MKFRHSLVLLLSTLTLLVSTAQAAPLNIEVHHFECVDPPIDKVQRAVADYENYPCNPSAKLKLSRDILSAAKINLPPGIDWGIQVADLAYVGAWDAPVASSADPAVAKTLPEEMRNRFVWLQFQPLNLGCTVDTAECRKLALLYPRLLLYCKVDTNPDGTEITNHCKLVPRPSSTPPKLTDNFAVDSYDSKTIVIKNSPKCERAQTRVEIHIKAVMKGEDLDAAIDASNLNPFWKAVTKIPLLESVAYNSYFESFNDGFVYELNNPRTCTVPVPPAAELPRF